MKKLLAPLSTLIFIFSSPALAFAQPSIGPCESSGYQNQFGFLCKLGQATNGPLSPGGVLGLLVNVMFIIAAIIALYFLVQGGIRWITSQGDTKNVEGARNQIIAAAVGLAVTFLSYLIINILLQFFIGTSINAITIPTLNHQ